MELTLSEKTRAELCKLVYEYITEHNMKLYPALEKAGLKGPAFYSYLEAKTVPSKEATAKIASLAISLDYGKAMKLIYADLNAFKDFVGILESFASVKVLGVEQIRSTILGIPKEKKKRK